MRELLVRAKANLNRAIRDSTATGAGPIAGERWEAYARAVRTRFESLLTPLQAIHFAQDPHGHGGFELRESSEKLADMIEAYEENLAAEFPKFAQHIVSFEESGFSDPRFLALSNDRLVSRPMYAHARLILRCLSHGYAENIVEIGGGYGAPARLWMTNAVHRPKLYVDVDLPESLFFAENYLGMHFGAESLVYLHRAEDLEELSRPGLMFVLCPVGSLELLHDLKFDLAWNSHSMSEMSEDYVDYYMRWLDRNRPDRFFSCNRLGCDLTNMRESVNFMSPLPSEQWEIVHSQVRGTGSPWIADMMMRIMPSRTDREPEIRELLRCKLTPQSYLRLVDATRAVKDGALVWEIIQKVSREYDYIPKEIVHLCRLVTRLGASPSPAFDTFRDNVEQIASRSPRGRVSPHLREAAIEEPGNAAADVLIGTLDGSHATIAGRAYDVSSDYFGAVEQISHHGDAIIAYGWAADTKRQEPVTTICGFAGDDLVAIGKPTFERHDIVKGWGEWSLTAGFRLRLPATERRLCFLALTASGRAGRLNR
jgi:putative sugar O-methyltransferase